MLQSIRDRTHGWIAGIIISLLILSFALWGISSYLLGGSANTAIAKVNGVEITQQQLSVAYERLRRQLQTQVNSEEAISVSTEAAIKERALQGLISTQVLKQASLAERYRISSRQIDNFLESMPEFQVNGQFSAARLQQILAGMGFTINDFIDLIRTTLLIDQPRLGIIFSSFSLPNEVTQMVTLLNQERDIDYLTLPFQYFLNRPLVISDSAILAYYQKHQDDFKTTEQVSIEYILLSLKDLIDSLYPTEEAIKTFYNENSNLFLQPFEKEKDKIKEVYVHQKAEERFADVKEKLANVAYEHPESLEAASKELGLPIKTTGLFTKDHGSNGIAVNNKIREIAFSQEVLTAQNNSDVIQMGADTIVVLRVKSHLPASQLSLEAVKNQIIDKLKLNNIDVQTSQLANEISKKLKDGADPLQIANQYHLTWEKVGLIGRHSTKVDSAILETAFAMPAPHERRVSYGVAKISNGYAIIGLKAVQNGNLTNASGNDVFAEQIQNSQGVLEYELYKQSLMKQAKIVIGS